MILIEKLGSFCSYILCNMKSIKLEFVSSTVVNWCLLLISQLFGSITSVTVTIPLHLSKMTPNSYNFESLTTNESQEYNFNVRGRSGQGYFISVFIGTPPQNLNVLIDTGSSNFAIAAVTDPLISTYFHLNKSTTFQHKNTSIVVPYTMGSWRGFLGSDMIKLDRLIPFRSDIACITHAEHFFINGSEWQGILGLAYADIARPNKRTIPLFDGLVDNDTVSNVFSLQLCGEQGRGTTAGRLVLGGVDRKLHADQIRYTPLNRAWYYEVVLTGLRVGWESLDVDCRELNNDKTIVDSGTTNLRLPQKVFTVLVDSLSKQIKVGEAVPDDFWTGATFMCWNQNAVLHGFPELRLSFVHSRNSTFTLVVTSKQYLRQVLDTGDEDDYNKNNTCYKFAITPSETGTVIGAVVMEGFYVVFDRQNRRIGFAKSICSPQGNNKSDFGPEIEGPFSHPDPWSCVHKMESNKTLQVVSYVLSGLAVVFALPLIIMLMQWGFQRWQHRKLSRLIDSSSITDE